MITLKLNPTEILVLRTCDFDGTSRNGFKWPTEGHVECSDWDPKPVCGHGLHGLPWGVGRAAYLDWDGDTNNGWVVKVDTSKDYVHGEGEFHDKCKFKSGTVVLSNASRKDCIDLITRYAPKDSKINWSIQTGCECSKQTAGHRSAQSSGNASTQTAGHRSVQDAGNYSTQTAGNESTQIAGKFSIQMAGKYSTQTCWNRSYQKAGKRTVQSCKWFDATSGEYQVAVRIVDEITADKWFYVEDGVWRLATEEDIIVNKLI